MKWRSEKDIPFSMGIGSILAISFCNLLTIIVLVQLYTSYPALDNCIILIPEGILTKENKWLIVFAILPIAIVAEKLIEAFIYKKHNKKELFKYFEKMPPRRKIRGKLMFITYSLATLIALFVFGSMYINKMYPKADEVSPNAKHRLEMMLNELKERDVTDPTNLQ